MFDGDDGSNIDDDYSVVEFDHYHSAIRPGHDLPLDPQYAEAFPPAHVESITDGSAIPRSWLEASRRPEWRGALIAAVADISLIYDEVEVPQEGFFYVDDYVLYTRNEPTDEDLPEDHNPPALQPDGRPSTGAQSRQPQGATTVVTPREQTPATSQDF